MMMVMTMLSSMLYCCCFFIFHPWPASSPKLTLVSIPESLLWTWL